MKNNSCNMRKYAWSFNREIMFFDPKEIYYFDSYYRKTHLHTASNQYRIADKLDQIHKYLVDYFFIRIHQNYLVNMDHIKVLRRNKIILRNGEILEISARRKKMVYDTAKQYLHDKKE